MGYHMVTLVQWRPWSVITHQHSTAARRPQALVALYESEAKPQKAVDFLKTQLGAPTPEDMAAMQAEKEDLSKQLEEAQARRSLCAWRTRVAQQCCASLASVYTAHAAKQPRCRPLSPMHRAGDR